MEFIFIYQGDNIRIDKVLADYLQVSRSLCLEAIKNKDVLVNGNYVKPSFKLNKGDKIEGKIIEKTINYGPENIDLDIIYEDPYIIGINKQAGLVVHLSDSTKSSTLVNGLLNYTDNLSDINGKERRGIVHRLDKDTSGVILIAKDNHTHKRLQEQFANRLNEKYYLALVHGKVKETEGKIDYPIGRNPINRSKMGIVENGGRDALTYYQRLAVGEDYSLLRIRIVTGRTHQIRVHLSVINHPILGDELYGLKREKIKAPRQMLHASELIFEHPYNNIKTSLKAKLPDDFKTTADKAGICLNILSSL